MKSFRYIIILFTLCFCGYGCSDTIPTPRTEDEEDPIIIGDPDGPLPDYPSSNADTVCIT